MAEVSWKEKSKVDWQSEGLNDSNYPGHQHIQLGCLMRIADATEMMASNYTEMQADLEWYKKQYERIGKENERMARRIAGFQGYIKRLKKQTK